MVYEHNSFLYHLAYVRLVSLYIISLEVTEPIDNVTRGLTVLKKELLGHLIYWFLRAAMTKYHKLGGFNHRNLFWRLEGRMHTTYTLESSHMRVRELGCLSSSSHLSLLEGCSLGLMIFPRQRGLGSCLCWDGKSQGETGCPDLLHLLCLHFCAVYIPETHVVLGK